MTWHVFCETFKWEVTIAILHSPKITSFKQNEKKWPQERDKGTITANQDPASCGAEDNHQNKEHNSVFNLTYQREPVANFQRPPSEDLCIGNKNLPEKAAKDRDTHRQSNGQSTVLYK